MNTNLLLNTDKSIKHQILLIALYIVFSLYIKNYILYFILLLINIFILFFYNKGKISKKKIKLLLPYNLIFTTGALIGAFGFAAGNIKTWPYFRDLILMSFPFLTSYFSYFICEKNKFNTDIIFSSIFIAAGIASIVSLVNIASTISREGFGSESIGVGRSSEWLISFALYLIITKNNLILNKKICIIFSILIIVDFFLGFSRTTLVILLILLFSSLLDKKISFKKIFIFVIAFFVILFAVNFYFPNIMYGFISMFNLFINKLKDSFTETSSKLNWNEITITNNWRGFEIYSAQKQFKNSSLITQIIGNGYGSTVNVGIYAHMVTPEDALPYLHNGYYTALIKSGIVGLLLFLLQFIFICVFQKKNIKTSQYRHLAYSLDVAMIVSSWVIGGVFLGGSNTIFILSLISLFDS